MKTIEIVPFDSTKYPNATTEELQLLEQKHMDLECERINSIFEAERPISKFSWYLDGCVSSLLETQNEILEHFEKFSFSGTHFDDISKSSKLLWFWILGAYEVVRTMCESKGCFDNQVSQSLTSLKISLAEVRMPAAKMEERGKKNPVTSSRSPFGINIAEKDLEFFATDNKFISARKLMDIFKTVLSSIKVENILKKHEDSYSSQK